MAIRYTNGTNQEVPLEASRESQTRANILIAGPRDSTSVLADILIQGGFAASRVEDGLAALERLRHAVVDVLILDRSLHGLDALDVCRVLKRDHDTRLVPVMLLLPGFGSREERLEAIEAGADQVMSMPVDVPVLTAMLNSLTRAKRATDDCEQVASVMTTLCAMLEARDRYGEGHCHRMANYAGALGKRIGLSGEQIHSLRRGGFVHDIGMLTIPDEVLLKPGALDKQERALIESHTIIGESLIENLRSLKPVRQIVRHHHERRDGSGYPDGLRGEEIPLGAQIVGLCDVFEALTSVRPYQGTNTPEEALRILQRQVDRGWHRTDLYDEFAAIIRGD